MSSHQSNRDKPRASKCHHFCHAFDTHNYCPTCREASKGDDPCVTFISPCDICSSFTEEQLTKITHRKRYVKKPDKKADKNDQELDLLGDNSVESFAGSQADLESAADHLFTSPPRPQPLVFEALLLKTPAKTVPPTPGTALQQKLETKLEKSLGSRLDIQLDLKMGAFQANILEAMKSLREDFQKSLSKTSSQVEVDQTSTSASKPGASNTRLDPPRVLILSSRWTLIMAQPYLLVSTLIVASMMPRVTMLVLSRNPRGCPRPNQRNLLILSNSMLWPRALPRTTTLIILMNLGLHLAEPRNILINLNTNLGPDIYLLPQRRISPLRPDIGLQNLLGRPTLIKTILNMTQILLTTGK